MRLGQGQDTALVQQLAAEPDVEERPATDAQLLRIGRALGLRYAEAAALLDALAEAGLGPQRSQRPGGEHSRGASAAPLSAALASFPPDLLAGLRAVPGLFLLTDGVTFSRLERALRRVRGLGGARLRLLRYLGLIEEAATEEARLVQRVARALQKGQKGRRPASAAPPTSEPGSTDAAPPSRRRARAGGLVRRTGRSH